MDSKRILVNLFVCVVVALDIQRLGEEQIADNGSIWKIELEDGWFVESVRAIALPGKHYSASPEAVEESKKISESCENGTQRAAYDTSVFPWKKKARFPEKFQDRPLEYFEDMCRMVQTADGGPFLRAPLTVLLHPKKRMTMSAFRHIETPQPFGARHEIVCKSERDVYEVLEKVFGVKFEANEDELWLKDFPSEHFWSNAMHGAISLPSAE